MYFIPEHKLSNHTLQSLSILQLDKSDYCHGDSDCVPKRHVCYYLFYIIVREYVLERMKYKDKIIFFTSIVDLRTRFSLQEV